MSAGALLGNLEAPKPAMANTVRFSPADNVSFSLLTITQLIQNFKKNPQELKDLLEFLKSRRIVVTVVKITTLY